MYNYCSYYHYCLLFKHLLILKNDISVFVQVYYLFLSKYEKFIFNVKQISKTKFKILIFSSGYGRLYMYLPGRRFIAIKNENMLKSGIIHEMHEIHSGQ